MNFQQIAKLTEKQEKNNDDNTEPPQAEREDKKPSAKNGNDRTTDTNSASESVTSNGKDTKQNDSESMDIDVKVDDTSTKKEKSKTKKERKSNTSRYHDYPFGGTERTALQQQSVTSNQNNTSTSFLDGLKEEDRRTRTRLLPAVEGFRKLHKSEIKQDLKLARATMKKGKKEEDEMEEEDEVENNVLAIGPFIPPNKNDTEESDTEEIKKKQETALETISAYNPPRPPESIGPKKKHRLLRWERHPNEIEIDLDNYKKTVDKTRFEWRKLVNEYQNVECRNGVLRNHFVEHAKNLKMEGEVLDEEFGGLVGRIREVVGAENGDMIDFMKCLQGGSSSRNVPKDVKVSGIGGITPLSSSTNQPLGSGWTIPGDKVQTPYGEGMVLDILPIGELNPNNPPPASLNTPTNIIQPSKEIPPFSYSGILLPSRLCIKLPFGVGYFTPDSVQVINQSYTLSNDELLKRWEYMYTSALNEGMHCDHNSTLRHQQSEETCYHYIPQNAHISPFLRTFDVTSAGKDQIEDTNVVSASSSQMDIEGGGSISEHEDNTNVSLEEQQTKENTQAKNSRKRLADSLGTTLPLDFNLLPCGSQRGTMLINLHNKDLESCLENQFSTCKGIIGTTSNTQIPKNLLTAETNRLTLLSLQAQLLQKRNALYRQRKIRQRNERCFSNSVERANKIEKFMVEMKEDYIGLKGRLEKELGDLGIGWDKVNDMLRDYYRLEGCEVVSGND